MRFIFILICALIMVLGEAGEAQEFLYEDHGKRDPLWPLVSSTGSLLSYDTDFLITDLNLEGIMVGSAGRNIAIINGKVLEENQSIGQFLIKSIGSDTVILEKEAQTFELKLKKEESE